MVRLTSAKHALLRTMLAAGGFAPFRLANGRNGLVLMYHRFGNGSGAVSARDFSRHLRYLTRRYTVVSIPTMVARLCAGDATGRPMAAVTIDDGHADAFDVAFPVLKQFGVPATLFVVTGFIDGTCWLWTDRVRYAFEHARATRAQVVLDTVFDVRIADTRSRNEVAPRCADRLKHMPVRERNRALETLSDSLGVKVPVRPPPEYAPVTWTQLRELDRVGVAVESHTVTHPILTNLSNHELWDELARSKARLEQELNRPAVAFCYPNGDWNRNVRAAAQHAGYACAVTTTVGFNEPGVDPFALKRVGAEGDLARFVKTTSGFEQWQMSMWRAADPRA